MTKIQDVGAFSQTILEGPFRNSLTKVLTSINSFFNYKIQIVRLERNTTLDRVVETFERINRTGEPLSVTDLLVARLYQRNIKLRELMEAASDRYEFLRFVPSEFVLRVICLIRGREVRRRDILDLEADGFQEHWSEACEALERAFKRMTDRRDGYGAFDFARFAPFSTVIVPLAAMLWYIRQHRLETHENYRKIDRWYWTTIFQNRYNEAVNTQSFSDYSKMKDWFLDDDKVMDVVSKFAPHLVDLRIETKNSAIFRGCMCLVAKAGALDFETGQPPQFSSQTEDEHIFPRAVYRQNEIFNRTIIDKNEKKGAQAPSVYFKALEVLRGRQQLERILETHLIDANALSALLDDDIDRFRMARESALKARISCLVNG